MAEIKIPVASPRKSIQELEKSKILNSEVTNKEHDDIVTEVARQILEENIAEDKSEIKTGLDEEAIITGLKKNIIEVQVEIENNNSEDLVSIY